MVVINKQVRNMIVPLALTSLIFLDGCKTEEGPQPKFSTDLLLGDWLATEIAGDPVSSGYSYIFTFKANGDIEYCYEYDVYSYCNNAGKWRWQDVKNEKLVFTDTDNNEQVADVIVLDVNNFEFDLHYTDTSTEKYKFVKVK